MQENTIKNQLAGQVRGSSWKRLSSEDGPVIKDFYERQQTKFCDYTFANNVLWGPYYQLSYQIIEGFLVIRIGGETPIYTFPMGEGNLVACINILEREMQEEGLPFALELTTKEQFDKLSEAFPGKYAISWNRDIADYVYEREKLVELEGKKLHAKRNFIRQFEKEYPDWSYEQIDSHNLKDCVEMATEWCKLNECCKDEGKRTEIQVTMAALYQLEHLGLTGGLLRAGGRVVAFAIGEKLNNDTFVVHIEKAFYDVKGAYPMINREFARHAAEGYRFVNREDDAGQEGLRKAKLSYYPDEIVEKGLVTRIGTIPDQSDFLA